MYVVVLDVGEGEEEVLVLGVVVDVVGGFGGVGF